MKKFAVILSGSGVYDGAEIHEAAMTMLAIDKLGAEYTLFAPNKNQHHVINHITGEEMNETRNVLIESARIARGNIHDLSEFTPNDFDALIIPGGFGAAKNLSDYAFQGTKLTIEQDVEDAIIGMHQLKKPIGALCIAPVILARALNNPTITIGNDAGTIEDIKTIGAYHKESKEKEVIIDKDNLLFTTPCYMLEARISDIAESAENLIKEILKVL